METSQFKLSLATSEDICGIQDLKFEAYGHNREFAAFFPPGTGLEVGTEMREWQARHDRTNLLAKSTCTIKIVDETTNAIVAAATWTRYKGRSERKAGKDGTLEPAADYDLIQVWGTPPFPDQMNSETLLHLLSTLEKPRHDTMGFEKPYWYASSICVHPEYQHRGLGSQLVQYFVDKADSEHIACYLEASQAGRKFYGKYGYRVVKEYNEAGFVRSFMVREAGALPIACE